MADEDIPSRAHSTVSQPMARVGNCDSRYIVLLYLVMFIVWVSRRRGIRLFVFVEVYRTGVPSPNSIGSLVQSGQIIFAGGVLLANRLVCVLMVR